MKALGMGTGFTHMEWFLTNQGEVLFGEIACRSPGANMVDLMNFAGDIDLYSAWGQAVIHGGIRQLNPKRRSAAIVFKPPLESVAFNVSRDSELLSISTVHTPALTFCRLVPTGGSQTKCVDGTMDKGSESPRGADQMRPGRGGAPKLQ